MVSTTTASEGKLMKDLGRIFRKKKQAGLFFPQNYSLRKETDSERSMEFIAGEREVGIVSL